MQARVFTPSYQSAAGKNTPWLLVRTGPVWMTDYACD